MKPRADALPTPRTRPGRDYRRSGALVTRSRSPLPTERRDLRIIPVLRAQTRQKRRGTASVNFQQSHSSNRNPALCAESPQPSIERGELQSMFGCTSCWAASSASVLSPTRASRATLALNSAEKLRRVPMTPCPSVKGLGPLNITVRIPGTTSVGMRLLTVVWLCLIITKGVQAYELDLAVGENRVLVDIQSVVGATLTTPLTIAVHDGDLPEWVQLGPVTPAEYPIVRNSLAQYWMHIVTSRSGQFQMQITAADKGGRSWDFQVHVDVVSTPSSFRLTLSNRPNPFNPSTLITYAIDSVHPQPTRLEIFNSLGQSVSVLVDKAVVAGTYTTVWDGRDSKGHRVSSGLYFSMLTAGSTHKINKMILLE